jgi:hypothetical protein
MAGHLVLSVVVCLRSCFTIVIYAYDIFQKDNRSMAVEWT